MLRRVGFILDQRLVSNTVSVYVAKYRCCLSNVVFRRYLRCWRSSSSKSIWTVCLAHCTASNSYDRLKGNRHEHRNCEVFNATKGFGFIEQGNGQPDVFVPISVVERAGMNSLREGQKLGFDIVKDNRNGKSAAENLMAA